MGIIQDVMDGSKDETPIDGTGSDQAVDDGAVEALDEFGRSVKLLEWEPLQASKLSPQKKAACEELFRRGDISFFLHPEQKKLLDWIDQKYREVSVICISRQFGKTTMLLAYALAYCITHPRSAVLFIAPHKRQLEDFIMPKLNLVFSFLPDDLIPTQRGLQWTFPGNGATFRLDGVGIGKGTRIRGAAVDLIILDECRDMEGMKEMIESHLSPMFATTDGRLICISTPPESPLHDFTDKYIREAMYGDYFYTATYKQNPLLSTKRLRYLMNELHPGGEKNPTFRREYMADFSVADLEKRVVREWDEERNDLFFKTYNGPPNPVRPYVGCDYGFSDPCGLLVGYYDYVEGALIIDDEYFERGKNTDDVGLQLLDMERRMRERLPGAVEPIRVMDVDPSLMSSLWKSFGLRFEPAAKVPSIVAMMNKLRIAFSQGKIRIRNTCPQLRFQLKAGVYNEKGTEYIRTNRGGHLDLIDSLKYISLNMRWHEILTGAVDPNSQGLRYNQMNVSPFANKGQSFKTGVLSRPT